METTEKTWHRGPARDLTLLLLALIGCATMLTWAWKSVAVAGFGLPALGWGPALAVTLALAAAAVIAGAGLSLGARLSGPGRG